MNLTVSKGTDLLSQEQGSTVKHLNYQVPTCVPIAFYSVSLSPSSTVTQALITCALQFTIHETAKINNEEFYTITFIPIQIEAKDRSGSPATRGAADALKPSCPCRC